MEIVCPSLRDNVNDGSIVAPKFWQVAVGDHPELLRGFRVERTQAASPGSRPHFWIVIVRAIEQKIVAPFARTVNRKAAEQ